MKRRTSITACLTLLGTAIAAIQGCSSTDVPIAKDGNSGLNNGQIDAGTGLCGAATCASGELCCASADESCSPTCTKASTCPVYGRACRAPLDAGPVIDSGPPVNNLKWYATCGDPICRAEPDGGTDAGPDPVCAAEGTACTTRGATCGNPQKNCGVVSVCDDHDPRSGSCPISSAKFKDGIHYLRDAELQRLHEETMSMRLATYQYKGQFADPNPTHLGFIIEDQPQSLSVDRGHDRVDIYGYVSMIVAAMQVQEKEIASLRQEVQASKAGACTVTPKR